MDPILHGERIVLRPVADHDLARLAEIHAEPEVARWWGGLDAEGVREAFLDADDVVSFVIELDGEVIGGIQYAEETEPDYRHATVDVFLTSARAGQGLGSESVRVLARYLFTIRGHHRLTIDPAAANERAIRAYERVGFRRVGVMRRYERGRDGTWHDGLLMDMLEEDLDAPAS